MSAADGIKTESKGAFLDVGYVPGIDGLRAIAIIAVVVYHAYAKALPGGLAGVDIFFVVSGFVVSASILKRRSSGFGDFLTAFYVRRLIRIIPPLIVMLVVGSLLAVLFIPKAGLAEANIPTAIASFLGVSNFSLYGQADDYFLPRVEYNMFTHTWSLAIEEQFYVLFPILSAYFVTARQSSRARQFTIFAYVLLSTAAFVTACIFSRRDPTYAFYSLTCRFWELGLGVLVYLTLPWTRAVGERIPAAAHACITVVGLVAIVLSFALSPATAGFPIPQVVPAVLGTALLVYEFACRKGQVALGVLDSSPVVYIGKISYSLYLWHWPVFTLLRWTVGFQSPATIAVGLVLAGLLGVLSYRFVEMPARAAPKPVGRRRLITIGGTLAKIAVSMGLVWGLGKFQQHVTLSVTAANDWQPFHYDRTAAGCPVAEQRGSLGSDTDMLFQPDCKTPLSDRVLYVVGDSHAFFYASIWYGFAKQTGMKVRVFTRPGCAMVLGLRPIDKACKNFAEKVFATLDAVMTKRDVLFLPALRIPRLREQSGEIVPPQPSVTPAEAREAEADANRLLANLRTQGIPVILEYPPPVFKSSPFRCSDWFNRMNPSCADGLTIPRDEVDAMRKPVEDMIDAVKRDNSNVSIWNPWDLVCDKDVCHAFRNGKPMFLDTDHSSGYGNQVLLERLRPYIMKTLGLT